MASIVPGIASARPPRGGSDSEPPSIGSPGTISHSGHEFGPSATSATRTTRNRTPTTTSPMPTTSPADRGSPRAGPGAAPGCVLDNDGEPGQGWDPGGGATGGGGEPAAPGGDAQPG